MNRCQLAVAIGATWVVASYIVDVIMRPTKEAQRARQIANHSGKPMLNVGAGTSESSVRARILGPQLVGDINVDLSASKDEPYGPFTVAYGDMQNLPFPDKFFGVAYSSHVLEHVDDPIRALNEMNRVADNVVIVTPKWWAAHTWLYHNHKWYISDDQKRAYPLWNNSHKRTLMITG